MECDFSRGGLMVTKHQNGLKHASVHALMKVGSWYSVGLLDRPTLVKMFNELHKRPKKGKGKELEKM
jgi:hypothetical protein